MNVKETHTESKFVRNMQKLRKISLGLQINPYIPKKPSIEDKTNCEYREERLINQTNTMQSAEKRRGKSINSERRITLCPISKNLPFEIGTQTINGKKEIKVLTDNNNLINLDLEYGPLESIKNNANSKYPQSRKILKCATHVETKNKRNKMKGGRNILEEKNDKIAAATTFLQKPKLIKKDEELINYSSKLEMLLQKERKENMEKRTPSLSLDNNKLKLFLKSNDKNNDAMIDKESKYKLSQVIEPFAETTKIFNVNYNQDDTLIAYGCEGGKILIFDNLKKRSITTLEDVSLDLIQISNLRWRPKTSENILVSTTANGFINFWDIDQRSIIRRIEENDNHIYALDYNSSGANFATGGIDKTIRVYDDMTCKPICCLQQVEKNPGHSNRIFSIKFDNNNPNILYSGGWDDTIYIWDTRTSSYTDHIYGPRICSDTLDQRENELLCGSWREEKNLQLFDLRSTKLLQTLPFPKLPLEKKYVFSCKMSKNTSRFIVAGLGGQNSRKELVLYGKEEGAYRLADLVEMDAVVHGLDFEKMGGGIGWGGKGGGLMEIVY